MRQKRGQLIAEIFGTSSLPEDSTPVETVENDEKGFPVTHLVWDLGYNGATSTAYHTQTQAEHISDTLIIWHNGHMVATKRDHMGMSRLLNMYGFDVLEFAMPGFSWNAPVNAPATSATHEQFSVLETQGAHPLSLFIGPVIRSVNWAARKGYKHVHMIGISGGGWTTTVAAAIDPRIESSFEIAGTLPFDLRHQQWSKDHGDFEQDEKRPLYRDCDMECFYMLGALEPGRRRVQMLHEKDDCCFAAEGRHKEIRAYERRCQDATDGRVSVLITDATTHTVNMFERRHLLEALTEGGLLAL